MTQLIWDAIGERIYEAGLDRGVLYPIGKKGVPWNGLVAVKETPSGGTATPYYIDGVKYLNEPGPEEFAGTIEAFTYPDEFAECDGTAYDVGLGYGEQPRKPFNLSYRTLIGNDLLSTSYGYKIHLIYNALADPTDVSNGTTSQSPTANMLSWGISTTPVVVPKRRPTAHLTIDSTKLNRYVLREIESILYGTATQEARFPTPIELASMQDWSTLKIVPNSANGLSTLVSTEGIPDLMGARGEGFYSAPEESRLTETAEPGLYRLD